jgi:hypothetical protein
MLDFVLPLGKPSDWPDRGHMLDFVLPLGKAVGRSSYLYPLCLSHAGGQVDKNYQATTNFTSACAVLCHMQMGHFLLPLDVRFFVSVLRFD